MRKSIIFVILVVVLVDITYAAKPTTPVVMVDSWYNGSGGYPTIYWTSTSTDGIALSEYYILSSTVITWWDTPVETIIGNSNEITSPPLPMPLEHMATYYVVVKTQNNGGEWSDAGYASFCVDLTQPETPGKPVPSTMITNTPATQYVVTWNASSDLESGLSGYEIQEREGTSPVWQWYDVNWDAETASTTEEHTLKSDLVSGSIAKLTVLGKRSGHFYVYRVRAKNRAGSWSEWSSVSESANTGNILESITRISNYPNPFNPMKRSTTIAYILNENMDVKIYIYNLSGELMRKFEKSSGENGSKQGPNAIVWDGKNDCGETLASGIYFIRLSGESFTKIVKAAIIK